MITFCVHFSKYDLQIVIGVKKQCQKLNQIVAPPKRFKKTGKGGYKHAQSHRRHILTKKSSKRKRHLRDMEMVAPADVAQLDRQIPYA